MSIFASKLKLCPTNFFCQRGASAGLPSGTRRKSMTKATDRSVDFSRELKQTDLSPEWIERRRSIHRRLRPGALSVFGYGDGPLDRQEFRTWS